MRIKSLRRERYPFCARRFLRRIKETEREINDGSLDRSLLFWFAFEPQWVYAVLIQQLLFSLLSNFVFGHRLLHCLLIVNVRSETKYSSPRKQWNCYDMHVQYFNINSQRFNSRLSSWQSASRLCPKSITAPLSLLISLKAHALMPNNEVVIRGEVRGRFLINAV